LDEETNEFIKLLAKNQEERERERERGERERENWFL
jgi:hypothetical protein